MKDWVSDHPKAKLMAQKRTAILEASRESFLRHGYGGTSMESIADLAGISIMTLYRHAENKDDLFSTVVTAACSEEEKAELKKLTTESLGENLTAAAMLIQQKLADPQTVALLRAVMGEVARFPQLADMTYKSLIGHFEITVEQLLSEHPESLGVRPSRRRDLSVGFVDQLVGADVFRTLLGLAGATPGEQLRRAERARDGVLSAIR